MSSRAMPAEGKDCFLFSVRELAGVSSVSEGGMVADARLRLGQHMHRIYRLKRESEVSGYEAERTVRWSSEVDGYAVGVSGRMDGLYQDQDRWVVEELKSWTDTSDPVKSVSQTDLFGSSALDAYAWQCRLYCHFLSQELGPGASVAGTLVLMDVFDQHLTRIDVGYDDEICSQFVQDRISSLIAERVAQSKQRRRRRAWAERITFPFDTYRPFQRRAVEDVQGAASFGLNLALSAPTGIGKTAAVLQPMLKACIESDRRLLFTTAKVSQQELALQTAETLVEPGCGVTVVQLESKERSCPQKEILCIPKHCDRIRDWQVRMAEAELPGRLLRGGVVWAEQIRREADSHGLCPFELGLSLAYGAEAVVCDFNYAFHPSVALSRLGSTDFASRKARRWSLVVDEAHNLYRRAIEFLSPALERVELHELEHGCMSGPSPIYRELLEWLLDLDAFFEDVVQQQVMGPRASESISVVDLAVGPIGRLQERVELWLLDYLAYIKSGGRRPMPFVPYRKEGSRRVVDPAIDFCFRFFAFAEACDDLKEDRVVLLRRDETPGREVLQVQCLDPARYLGEKFKSFHSAVAMSATLEPLEFYLDGLGLTAHNHASSQYPSPFPAANRLLVADLSLSTRYEDRASSVMDVCTKIAGIALARPGNHLVFFPSYSYMSGAIPLVELALRKQGGNASVLVVTGPQATGEALEVLRRRAEDTATDSLVVCTVLGGTLAEGVDFPGEMAVSAVVVGPGLPMVTFERRLMLEYHDRRGGRGFEHAYLYPGLTGVVQAAGRVIRSETDLGVIVLLGKRFGETRYLELLPSYWQQELVLSSDSVAEAQKFWTQRGFGRSAQ